MTDGQTTDGESLAKASEVAAQGRSALYDRPGSPDPARDLELAELLVDDVVFVDDMVRFQAKLSASLAVARGDGPPRRRRPRGDPKASREIENIRVTLPPDGQTRGVELGHRPKQTGEFVYTLEVEPPAAGTAGRNQSRRAHVNVRKEKLKVLLVDSEPRYEYRYLKNYLEA